MSYVDNQTHVIGDPSTYKVDLDKVAAERNRREPDPDAEPERCLRYLRNLYGDNVISKANRPKEDPLFQRIDRCLTHAEDLLAAFELNLPRQHRSENSAVGIPSEIIERTELVLANFICTRTDPEESKMTLCAEAYEMLGWFRVNTSFGSERFREEINEAILHYLKDCFDSPMTPFTEHLSRAVMLLVECMQNVTNYWPE